MDLNPEVEYHIAKNVPWLKLPSKIQEIFGKSQKGYEKSVVAFSVRNQLRYSENLVRFIRKDEGNYYTEIVNYSKEHLMLFPYHLSDRIIKGLRITPFEYYISAIEKIMDQDKSYDSLPNFTAADCLRLLGIGRNQYIELMNSVRSSRKYFRRKPSKDYLPTKPVPINIEPWYIVQIGYITENDINLANVEEKKLIDFIMDNGGQRAGDLDYDCVHNLFIKGLIYLDVPVHDDDYIIIPPLEGFVMNRLLGDYFENLLYKIFVSLDEHTKVNELATVLDIDSQLIKNAISVYCRLGFAYKKNLDIDYAELHQSWRKYQNNTLTRSRGSIYIAPDEKFITDELTSAINESETESRDASECSNSNAIASSTSEHSFLASSQSMTGINALTKRIGLIYDSTLTAYLMMGNLSPGLKNHAVTMFEVGKMADESLDFFLTELEQIAFCEGEGEAQRYFEHAKTLKKTVLFLRFNSKLGSMPLDLLRCESLLNLDTGSCSRLLTKNYALLVAMAPISHEVKPIYCPSIPYFGPIPHVNSIWFKLFIYSKINCGPVSLFLSRGSILQELPKELDDCNKYLVTAWGHDPGVIPGINALLTINDALCHSALLIQEYGIYSESSTIVVPFPLLSKAEYKSGSGDARSNYPPKYSKWTKHPAIQKLSQILDLESNFGYITMMNTRGKSSSSAKNSMTNQKVNFESNLEKVVEEMEQTKICESESDENIHFATVPEPKNGFKDEKCAKLYKDELESLIDDEQKMDKSEVQETEGSESINPPLTYDSRQQKIETLRLDLNLASSGANQTIPEIVEHNSSSNEELDIWFEDWTILDCHFGVPLFDSSVNQTVTERIISNGLFEEQSLESLLKSNEQLAVQLSEFINTCQGSSNMNFDETPLPSKSFYYSNGQLQDFF